MNKETEMLNKKLDAVIDAVYLPPAAEKLKYAGSEAEEEWNKQTEKIRKENERLKKKAEKQRKKDEKKRAARARKAKPPKTHLVLKEMPDGRWEYVEEEVNPYDEKRDRARSLATHAMVIPVSILDAFLVDATYAAMNGFFQRCGYSKAASKALGLTMGAGVFITSIGIGSKAIKEVINDEIIPEVDLAEMRHLNTIMDDLGREAIAIMEEAKNNDDIDSETIMKYEARINEIDKEEQKILARIHELDEKFDQRK